MDMVAIAANLLGAGAFGLLASGGDYRLALMVAAAIRAGRHDIHRRKLDPLRENPERGNRLGVGALLVVGVVRQDLCASFPNAGTLWVSTTGTEISVQALAR